LVRVTSNTLSDLPHTLTGESTFFSLSWHVTGFFLDLGRRSADKTRVVVIVVVLVDGRFGLCHGHGNCVCGALSREKPLRENADARRRIRSLLSAKTSFVNKLVQLNNKPGVV
jgi:hypothetical protein